MLESTRQLLTFRLLLVVAQILEETKLAQRTGRIFLRRGFVFSY